MSGRIFRSARPRYWRTFNPEKYGYGLKGLLRQAMNEHPVVFTAGVIALLSCIPGGYRYYRICSDKEDDYRRYKFEYTVIRDDDPRAEKVLNPNPNIKYREY